MELDAAVKFPSSKIEFRAQLHQSRSRSTHYLPEVRAGYISINGGRTVELSVIEDVKGLESKL
jgi:hypothetical protein